MPVMQSAIRERLKVICCPHDNSDITPPQVQGSFGMYRIIYPRYTIKARISIAEIHNPIRRKAGINNSVAMMSSLTGKDHAIILANGFSKPDWFNVYLN